MIKLSEVDKGKRVIAHIPNNEKNPIEIRTGIFIGFADTGLPLIQYDNIKIAKAARPEWLRWEE